MIVKCPISKELQDKFVSRFKSDFTQVVKENLPFNLRDHLHNNYWEPLTKNKLDKEQAQFNALNVIRIGLQTFQYMYAHEPEIYKYFENKASTDLNDDNAAFNPVELTKVTTLQDKEGEGLDAAIKFMFGKNKDITVPKTVYDTEPDIHEINKLLQTTAGFYAAAPGTPLVTHNFEYERNYNTEKLPQIPTERLGEKKSYLAMDYNVMRGILKDLFFSGKRVSSDIDYQDQGPLYLKLVTGPEFMKSHAQDLKPAGPFDDPGFNPAEGLKMLVVDADNNPVRFSEDGTINPDGKVVYYLPISVTKKDFDEKGNYIKTNAKEVRVIGASSFESHVNAYVAKNAWKVTKEQAEVVITNQLKALLEYKEFLEKNPEENLTMTMGYGSMGHIKHLGGSEFFRYAKLSEVNFEKHPFDIRVESMGAEDKGSGVGYFTTEDTFPVEVPIERPPVSKDYAEKIASLIFDDLNLINSQGESHPITLTERKNIIAGYINLPKPNDPIVRTFYLTDSTDGKSFGVKVQIEGVLHELSNPLAREANKKTVVEYFTQIDLNRGKPSLTKDKLTTFQKARLLNSTDPEFATKVHSKEYFGGVVAVGDPSNPDYYAIDHPKLHINFTQYQNSAGVSTSGVKFNDVEIQNIDGVLTAVPTKISHKDWIKNNFWVGHEVTNGRIIPKEAYFTYAPTQESLDKLAGKEPIVKIVPIVPKGPQDIDITEELEKLKESDDEEGLNKLKSQLYNSIEATEQQIKEAKEWYDKSPLKKYFPLKEFLNAMNTGNPNSIAKWNMNAITLFQGSNYTDLYHEAWHGFTQTFLTKSQKQELYREVRKLTGTFSDYNGNTVMFSKATDKQAEEFLAEDFRAWMLSGGKKVTGPKRRAWYQKIWDFLRALFQDISTEELLTDENSVRYIHELYEKLKLGNLTEYTFSQENRNYQELNKKSMEAVDPSNPTQFLTYSQSKLVLDTVDSLISTLVDQMNAGAGTLEQLKSYQDLVAKAQYKGWDKLTQEERDTINSPKQNNGFLSAIKTEKQKAYMYSNVKRSLGWLLEVKQLEYETAPEIDKNKLEKAIETLTWAYNNFGNTEDITKNELGKGVIGYHIDKSLFYTPEEREDFFANDKVDRLGQKEYDKAGNEQSVFSMADREVIYLITSLQARDNKDQPEINNLGVEKLVRFDSVWNRLSLIGAGSVNIEELFTRIVKESEYRPVLRQLLLKLGPLPSPDLATQNIWTKFLQAFGMAEIRLIQMTISQVTDKPEYSNSWDEGDPEEDETVTQYATTHTIKIQEAYRNFNKVGQRWKSEFHKPNRPSKFIKSQNNKNYLDLDSLLQEYSKVPRGREFEFYRDIGINFEQNSKIIQILETQTKDTTYYIWESLKKFQKAGIKITDLEQIFKGDKKHDIQEIIERFKSLQQIQANNSDEFLNFMVQNAEGETQFEHSLNNSMTVIVNTINGAKDFKDLMTYKYMQYLDPQRNPAAKYSVWLNNMFELQDENKIPLDPSLPNYGRRRMSRGITMTNTPVTLELTNLSGIGLEKDGVYTKEGVASADADEFSKLIYDFHLSNQRGLFEMMRHSDKTTSFSTALSQGPGYDPGAPTRARHWYIDPVQYLNSVRGVYQADISAYSMIKGHIAAELERVVKFRQMAKDKVQDYDFFFLEKGQNFVVFDKILKQKTKQDLYDLEVPLLEHLSQDTDKSKQLDKELQEQVATYLKSQAVEVQSVSRDAVKDGRQASFISGTLKTEMSSRALRAQYGTSFSDKEITEALFSGMVANSFIHNLESLVVFYGDLAQYDHDKEDFQKRIAGAGSTGKLFRTDQYMKSMLDNLNTKSFTSQGGHPTRTFTGIFQSAVIEDVNPPSFYKEDIKEAIRVDLQKTIDRILVKEPGRKKELDKWLEDRLNRATDKYFKIDKEGDAQGWISFDAYRDLMLAEGEWTDAHNKMYNKILRGDVLDKSQITEFFPTKKLQYYGPLATIRGIPMMGFHKFSLFPLIPSVIKGTNAEKLHNKLMREGIDYGLFKSGSKVATITKAKTEKDQAYSNDNLREFSETPFTKNPIYLEFLKDQLKIAPEYKGTITFSTQMRKLIEDGLFLQGVPVTYKGTREQWNKLTPEQRKADPTYKLVHNYEQAIHNLTEFHKQQILNQIGWSYKAGKLSGSMKNLMDMVNKELSRQDVGDHELEMLKVDKNGRLIYDVSLSPSADKIERLLNSMVVKRLVKQKVKGESLIQLAGTFFERPRDFNADSGRKVEEFPGFWTRDEVAIQENKVFLFGDNTMDRTKTGHVPTSTQAVIRGLYNAIGIDTKKNRSTAPNAYFTDKDFDIFKAQVDSAIQRAKDSGKTIIIPGDGIGTGKAMLEQKAPKLFKYLNDQLAELKSTYTEPKKSDFRAPTDFEKKFYGSNDLPFYHVKDGKIQAMKVKIALQGDFRVLLQDQDVKELARVMNISRREALNKLIRQDTWLNKGDNRKMITLVGTRIPTQGLNSMEFMEVYEFLEETAGNVIIPPSEIVTKSGSDFDIDKLTIMFPNIKSINKEPKFVSRYRGPESIEELRAQAKPIKDKLEEIKQTYKALRATALKNQGEKTPDQKQFMTQVLEPGIAVVKAQKEYLRKLLERKEVELDLRIRTENRKDDLDSINESISNHENTLRIQEELLQSNWDQYATDYNVESLFKLREQEEIEREPLELEAGKLDLKIQGLSKGSYENELLSSMLDILTMKENFSRLVYPNATDIWDDLAKEMEDYASGNYRPKDLTDADGEKRTSKKGKVISPTTALEIVYNLSRHRANSIGKKVLGKGAVDNTWNTLFNRIGAYMLPEGITKDGSVRQDILMPHNKLGDGISLSDIYDADGLTRISDSISQLINGWVDVGKDSWVFNLQGNEELSNVLLFLAQAGVPAKDIVYFLSNPLVKEYAKQQQLAKSTFAGILGTAPDNDPNFFRWKAKTNILWDPKNNFKLIKNKYGWYDKRDGGKRISNAAIYRMTLDYTKDIDFTTDKLRTAAKQEEKSTPTDFDRAVLLHFFEIEDMAKATTSIKLSANVDTKKSSTLFEARERIKKINEIQDGKRFPDEIINRALDPNWSPIASFYVQEFQIDLFGDLFPLRNSKQINESIDSGLRTNLKTTYPGDPEMYINNFRNDFVSYIFQNTLLPPLKKNVKNYKGYPVESSGILQAGAFLKDGVLHIDYDQIYRDFQNTSYTDQDYYKKSKRAILSTLDIRSQSDYIRFVLEREVLRYQNPFVKVRDTREFQVYFDTFSGKIRQEPGELVPHFQTRQIEQIYEEWLRDKALTNTYNLHFLFQGNNSFAAQFDRLVTEFPNLREEYSIISILSSSKGKGYENLRVNDLEIIGDKINLWHEELLTLANSSIPKLGKSLTPEDKWISDFFSKLPFVASLQSGLNTKGAFSLIRFIPTDKWIRLIEQNAREVSDNLNDNIVGDFKDKWVKANANYKKASRNRTKDLKTPVTLSSLLGTKISIPITEIVESTEETPVDFLIDILHTIGPGSTNRLLSSQPAFKHLQYHDETTSQEPTKYTKEPASYKTLVGALRNLKRLGLNPADFIIQEDKFFDVSYLTDRFGKATLKQIPEQRERVFQQPNSTIIEKKVIKEKGKPDKVITESWVKEGMFYFWDNKFHTVSYNPKFQVSEWIQDPKKSKDHWEIKVTDTQITDEILNGKGYGEYHKPGLLEQYPDYFFIHNSDLNQSEMHYVKTGDAVFLKGKFANRIPFPTVMNYDPKLLGKGELSGSRNRFKPFGEYANPKTAYISDLDGAIRPEVKERLDKVIGKMRETAKHKTLVFNNSGYGEYMIERDVNGNLTTIERSVAPATYQYLSEQLYLNFGFINPGFEKSVQGLKFLQQNQDITDKFVRENQVQYNPEGLPEISDENQNNC